MSGYLERRFELSARGTSVRTEVLAGTTTFFTLCYILFVQPAVMSGMGIPLATALFATCVASAAACLIMAFAANYPIALAPAMGHNFYVAYVVCGTVGGVSFGFTWQQALAANLVSGVLFLVLSLVRFRERLVQAVPEDLKHAIAAGIGLLIAAVGLQWGGLVVDHPGTLVTLGPLTSRPVLLTLGGLAVIVVLAALRVRAALMFGIAASAIAGMAMGLVQVPERLFTEDFLAAPVLAQLDFAGLFSSRAALEVVLVLLFLDLFDTVGTLVGVGARAGLLRDGELPRAGRAFLADACGTILGASLGTTTVTSYIESAAGVQAGGRTGLASVVTAFLLLLALPLVPLVAVIGAEIPGAGGASLRPVLAPTLIAIGALMMESAARVRWHDPAVALPCFLTIVIMPLSFSITEGIAFGVVAMSLAALAAGRARQVPAWLHVLAAVFVARYAFL